jgi:diaminopimelate epimerase
MKVTFWKAHGAGNDFLFTFRDECPVPEERLPELAVKICDRTAGVGADGLYLVERPGPEDVHARLHLFNSDGSRAELSGNGTRCAAAVLAETGLAADPIRISTGAGIVQLRLLSHAGNEYRFETAMPMPFFPEGEAPVQVALSEGFIEGLVVNVGNPQFAIPVPALEFDWRRTGREIESHPRFPSRTNVSFFCKLSDESIEARFYERGAGPTRSSGTGSVGAAVAAVSTGMARSPVTVVTEGGSLAVSWTGGSVQLAGPAVPVAHGTFITTLNYS